MNLIMVYILSMWLMISLLWMGKKAIFEPVQQLGRKLKNIFN